MNLVSYEVLLSYPDPKKPNVVRVFNEEDNEVFRSRDKELDDPDVVTAYGAYSPPGVVKASAISIIRVGIARVTSLVVKREDQ